MRRALVSRLISQDFPPRAPTKVTLTMNGNTTPQQTLIDTGADESLINRGLAQELGLKTEPLDQPVRASSLDASPDPAPGLSDYPDLSKVPPCYHDLKEVFSKSRANSLPPHRDSDCTINLIPGVPIPKARLYSISSPERKAMDEYIESH
ncbi:hypothetical protein L3Q82_019583 [Scortum barcoo]|uniref:Uncharacterized protein n=1 Tax=Scortum barcoo TaxID=214431 RepID=A0ACB8VC32_9TELE|nr:hypothetical protein L3Q82_019583 [Scortum barcoo]